LIEAQAGNPGAGKSAIAPPVGGVNAGNGGEISTPAGGTEITAPVGKPIPPNGISTMIGNFAGDVSMLADMVPVTEVGTADDAIEAQSVDPKAPPMGSEPGGDALAIEAMRNAATLFSPLNSLLLLNEI
jgi:hypothetical protein